MSLIKYILLSLILFSHNSKSLAYVVRFSGRPLGYADDLAACCTYKKKLDSSIGIACPWVYLAL